MIGDIPGAQMLEGLGDIKEDILPTITAEDAADGKFSDASRDVTSKMIFCHENGGRWNASRICQC